MTYLDRHGRPLLPGQTVTVQFATGPYGQTDQVTGTLQGIDQFHGVILILDHPFWDRSRQSTLYHKGERYYVASVFSFQGDIATGFLQYHGFEHDHDAWIEIQQPRATA